MRNLSSLLQRISKALDRGREAKETVIFVVTDVSKVVLEEHQIGIKEGVLEITTTSIPKNEISLKEKEIISSLNNEYKIPISKILYR